MRPDDLTVKPLANTSEAIFTDLKRYLVHHLGVDFPEHNTSYIYTALAYVVRDRIVGHWHQTKAERRQKVDRRCFYISMEYLLGRSLGNHILNLEIEDETKEALNKMAETLEEIEQTEVDAGLGNGGLGRLAACVLDSCANLDLPVNGYGLHYKYGMFRQRIIDGRQIEEPDNWMINGNPWEIERPELAYIVKFGGRVEPSRNGVGHKSYWLDTEDVLAIPCDLPITGYKVDTVNNLRLWKSMATAEFCLSEFNSGFYAESVADKNDAEHISMVLYPNDATENGKELRLRQQYFMVSATIQDIMRTWERSDINLDYRNFSRDNVIQLNDTHPSIAVAELMRILIDIKGLEWDDAWLVTTETIAYTNHTLLPEALETWSLKLFEKLLPRHLQIIYEINAGFMKQVGKAWPHDIDRMRRMSIIDENNGKQIRMSYLAIVGSFSVNGVAELHSGLLQTGLFKDFYELWPERFNNKTNGITPRRWLMFANKRLSDLIDRTIGADWRKNLELLEKLIPFAREVEFIKNWRRVKRQNKERLADLVRKNCRVEFPLDSLFDVQVKRIHEYKRQLLNTLHVIHLYNRIKAGNTDNWTNRCVLFAGKAAPGYKLAKDIIKLINNVAQTINGDHETGDLLKVVFLPNFGVSAMEIIAPGAELSEQISTAGKEASGTGNMKFMMNGAVTIGTYDGANIEIMNAAGKNNFFLFGMEAEEIHSLSGNYDPRRYIDRDEDLRAVIAKLHSGFFNPDEPGIFDDLINSMLNPYDHWMTIADFRSYVDTQERVSRAYKNTMLWNRMSIINTAKSGFFSSDRTVTEYNRGIWKL